MFDEMSSDDANVYGWGRGRRICKTNIPYRGLYSHPHGRVYALIILFAVILGWRAGQSYVPVVILCTEARSILVKLQM